MLSIKRAQKSPGGLTPRRGCPEYNLAFAQGYVQNSSMFKNMGLTEILVIVLVIVLLFGAKRIPDLARSLGRSISEFKKGRKEGQSPEEDKDLDPKV